MKRLGVLPALLGIALFAVASDRLLAGPEPGVPATKTAKVHNGEHDFVFSAGRWTTHIRRLLHPLSGSTTWVELNGTVVSTPVWGGRAQLEEIEASGADTRFEGLTLFLYNPQAHQWNQYFSNSASGVVDAPAVERADGAKAELFGQDTLEGRAILVRIVWSDISADSHKFEQSFSDDGGKTWEPNFVAVKTRVKP